MQKWRMPSEAALARTTAELTILADTEQKILTIAEDGYQTAIPSHFGREDAIRIGREKLREKAIKMGQQKRISRWKLLKIKSLI